jgi:hypothetical protein
MSDSLKTIFIRQVTSVQSLNRLTSAAILCVSKKKKKEIVVDNS